MYPPVMEHSQCNVKATGKRFYRQFLLNLKLKCLIIVNE